MRRAVCIVSPGNLASNPRVLKEADALHGAGYDVTAVVCDYNEALRQADDEIEAAMRMESDPGTALAARGRDGAPAAVLAKLLSAAGVAVPVGVAACSARAPVAALIRRAREVPADLYIAHYVAALPARRDGGSPARRAPRHDAEDFHSGEGTGARGRRVPDEDGRNCRAGRVVGLCARDRRRRRGLARPTSRATASRIRLPCSTSFPCRWRRRSRGPFGRKDGSRRSAPGLVLADDRPRSWPAGVHSRRWPVRPRRSRSTSGAAIAGGMAMHCWRWRPRSVSPTG